MRLGAEPAGADLLWEQFVPDGAYCHSLGEQDEVAGDCRCELPRGVHGRLRADYQCHLVSSWATAIEHCDAAIPGGHLRIAGYDGGALAEFGCRRR